MLPSFLRRRLLGGVAAVVLLAPLHAACGSDTDRTVQVGPVERDLDAGFVDTGPAPRGGEPKTPVLPAFCWRYGEDAVRDLFCVETPPAISGMAELQRRLGLDPARAGSRAYAEPMDGGATSQPNAASDGGVVLNLNVALLGHSTALAGSLVSPINPRIIVLGSEVVLAFHRGTQQVELATQSRVGTGLDFYLLRFVQACNGSPEGCSAGDLYTPRIESDWQNVTVADDEELKNTSSDCRQCHQRTGGAKTLLMRELNGPWTHWFAHDLDEAPVAAFPEPLGGDLSRDYRRAKGDEPYAAVPVGLLRGTIGLGLEHHVGYDQPLVFDAITILNERWPQGPEGFLPGGPRRSPTWDSLYQSFKRGEHLALPYFATRATDPAKQAALSEAYQRYRAQQLDPRALPDLGDIYPDDPQTRAEIGLQTEPLATPAETLIQACGSCHNDVLDQTLSRARFNIDLSRLTPAERELAVVRLQANPASSEVMPPHETRQLAAGARDALIVYLRSDTRPAADDALLARAARLGMAVITKPDRMPY